MANTTIPITNLPSLGAGSMQGDDLLPIVDVHDPYDAASGTTKQVTFNNMLYSSIPRNGRTVATLQAYQANNAVFNVKDFGATGDGVTDDAAAIQSTIDHAFAVGGGIVRFPVGSYLILTGLTGRALVSCIGDSKGVLTNGGEPNPGTFKGGVQIKAGAALGAMYTFLGSVSPEEADIVLQDLLFECNALATIGVSFRKCDNIFLRRVQVHTAVTSPFIIGTTGDTAAGLFWAYLDTCYANGTGGATTLYSISGTQVHLSRCLSDDGAIALSLVGGSSDVLVDDCRFEGVTTTGIMLGDFGFSQVVRNTTILLGANSSIGVTIGESQGMLTVESSQVFGGGHTSTTGIRVQQSGSGRGVSVTQTLVSNTVTGIDYAATYGGQLTNNTIEVVSSGTALLLQSTAANAIVTGNRLGGLSGATGVIALNNASVAASIVMATNLLSGTTTGRYFPTMVDTPLASAAGSLVNSAYGGMTSVSTTTGIHLFNSSASAGLLVISGISGGNQFIDLVAYLAGNISVVSSTNSAGSPAVRTYSASGNLVQLAMASGTYTVARTVLDTFRQ